MQTTEETKLEARVIRLECKVSKLAILLLLTLLALLATVIVFDRILEKEFSLPSTHQGTK